MRISIKSLLAIAGGALVLGACATPYDYGYGYDNYGYNGDVPYAPADGYYDSYPGYGYYGGPAVGFGLGFSSSDGWDHEHHGDWHGNRDHDRDRDRDHDHHH